MYSEQGSRRNITRDSDAQQAVACRCDATANASKRAVQAAQDYLFASTAPGETQLYKLLVSGLTSQAVFLADLTGSILTWNAGVLQILGYAEADFVGRDIGILFEEEEQRNGFQQNVIHSAICDGSALETRWHRRKDGSHIYSRRHFTLVRNESGDALGLAIQLHDETKQQHSDNQRQQLTESLQRSNDELSRLGHTLAHDLRGPLRTIGTHIALLEKDLNDRLDEGSRELMSCVLQGVDHMDHLVTSLLNYAQVQHSGFATSEVDLEVILQTTVAVLSNSLAENNAVITHDALPSVPGDTVLLLQLFQNIVGNALKYRKADVPRIHVSARETTTEWILCIQDNGIGIDPKYSEQIFLPLTRLHGPQIAGSGIGLAICKGVAERHGGRIWVESAVGCGAAFFFAIPKTSSAV